MGDLGVRPLLKAMVALEAAVVIGGLVGAAFAAVGGEGRATFTLERRIACPPRQALVGGACVSGKRGAWTLDSNAARRASDGRRVSYAWTVPRAIPPEGATITMEAGAQELTGNPQALVCSRLVIRGFERASGARELGGCADPSASTTTTRTVTLRPERSAPGTTVLIVEVGPGLAYRYAYRASPR
jgi:hypothetical protein